MQMKRRIAWKPILIAVALFAAVAVVGSIVGVKHSRQEQIVAQKQQEIQTAEGLYNTESIVLADTTPAQAKRLAQLLQARLRITEDGSYAVLYLPEGVRAEDVYQNKEYKAYLSAMSLDYYVSAEAVDANNQPLISARPSFVVTDELYSQQDYLDYINLQDTWAYTRGAGVTVAVIDTGIDTDHPEFAGRISTRSYDASNDRVVSDYGMSVIEDEQGHGTAVAGVIAAGMNDGVGITGIAPEVELIVIKCDADENGKFLRGSDLVFGLAYAIECDADVVNMSFSTEINIFAKYTQLAVDSDIICVAAAGNNGSAVPTYPAADENVIGVGAMDMDSWSLAEYSNYGFSLVLAPGTAYTTERGGTYKSHSGTSIASPVVAAATALYLSQNPYTEFEMMCELLKASSVDLGILGEDRQNAFGALDIHALVCAEKGTITYEMLTDELKTQTQIFVKGHTIQYMPEPERGNVVLDSWYHDIECTDEVSYFDTVFYDDVTLYASWINEDDGTAYVYVNLDDGTVEIQSYLGRRRYLTVPAMLEGKRVSSIGEYAFAGNGRLRSVTLPQTLTNISDGAFSDCDKIRAIEIPESVRTIGENAFRGCVSLSQVSLMRNGALTAIGDQAFAMCGISAIHLPENLTYLGDGVFYSSIAMQSITVEPGNTAFQILNGALYDAAGTTLLYYPANLAGTYVVNENTVAVADYAFAFTRCTDVVLNDRLYMLGNHAFVSSNVRTITLPSGIAQMGEYCFAYSSLSELTFTEGIELAEIPKSAFDGCGYLKHVTVPASVSKIGDYAFACTGLTSVVFEKNSNLEVIGGGAFAYSQLTSIEIPASVQGIGVSAFGDCRKLKSVTWESGSKLLTIDMGAFAYCTELKSVSFPESLHELGMLAFYESGLEAVTIGKNVTELGDGAFGGCHNLQSVTVTEENRKYVAEDGVVFSADRTALYIFPAGRSGSYTVPGTVVQIVPYAFAGASDLTNIELNYGLEEIGGYAFSRCNSLYTLSLPASLITIGENAFEYCTSLSGTLSIPKAVNSIGRYAFFNDYALTTIVIEPESALSRIGYGTFAYCGITDFTVPKTVHSMGQEIFAGCKNLLTVTFESGSQLESIAAWTFSGASELRQITFEEGNSLKRLEARSLEGLGKLERITLESCTQLMTIDNYAFQDCTALTELSLPDSLTEIGRYAFNRCKSLSRVDLPEGIVFIGRYAFNHTNNLNVYFHGSVLPLYLDENWDYGINGYYVSTAEVITSGDWQYALTSDGKASIVSYTGTETHVELTTMDGYEIISIGGYAFADNTAVQTITLPDTLQGIYQYAFKGTSALQAVTIPQTVTIVDNGAFQGSGIASVSFAEGSSLVNLGRSVFADTKNLTSIAIPEGVDAIRDYAFQNSALEEIVFAENAALTEIGRYAFKGAALKAIALPASVEKIDYDAFHSCTGLTSVDMSSTEHLQIFANAFYGCGLEEVFLPAGVEYVGEFCFTACQNLQQITVAADNENYASVDGVLYNKAMTKLITFPAGKTGSYTLPNTVTTLSFAAFEGGLLNEIIFPADSRLVTLGYRVFFDCDNLTAVAIPDSVQSIDNYAFAECERLTTVTFTENSQLSGIYKAAFYNNVSLTAIAIPDGVQEIGDYAFYGCSSLSDLQFSENSQLKGIYDYAFAYSGVTEFIMPAELQDIGTSAFQGTKLDVLVCNEALIEIGDYAFADCGLAKTQTLKFPATVQHMGYGVLNNVRTVKNLTLPALDSAPLAQMFNISDEELLNSGFSIDTLEILGGTTVHANACMYWKIGKVILSDSISTIEMGVFFNGTLGEVILPAGLDVLENGVFAYTAIDSIVLPDSITRIGQGAFNESTIQTVNFPENLEYIGPNAFANTNIEEVTISRNITEIGAGAFSGCDNLESIEVEAENPCYASVDGILYTRDLTKLISVPGAKSGKITVPDGVTEIPDRAFYYCERITEVKLPETVQSLGRSAFAECYRLRKINIPKAVTYIGDECFYHCSKLKSAEILNGAVQLHGAVFMGCSSLRTVTLPEGITEIPWSMFCACTSLTEIQIPTSVQRIGSNAFSGCYSLKTVTISAAVELIEEQAFSDCQSLEAIHVDPDNRVYTSVDGILYDAELTRIISVPAEISGHVAIPDGVKVISRSAFEHCNKLEGVTLPDSVEVIEMYAFASCSELSEIRLGHNIVNIAQCAFDHTAYHDNPDNWADGILYIGEYAVSVDPECRHVVIRDGTRLISHTVNANVETYWMPDSVRYISESSFNGADSLKSIRLSRNLEAVWGSLSSSLHSINLPDNVKKVSGGAFIGPNLQYIKGGAVENCYNGDYFIYLNMPNLKTLYIPYSSEAQLYLIDENCAPEEIIISTTGNMDTIFLQNVPYTTKLYTYVDTDEIWPAGWNHECDTYFKDEWNLATFYVNENIVTMDPMTLSEVVQVPAEMLVNEFLPEGSVFYGWDINGDGTADKLPVTLTEDLEAHAVFDVPISEIAFAETETTMEVTDEKVLEVLYTPSRFDSNGEVMWTSSDETVAIVDQNGKITALAEGQATITATLKENLNISASCYVNVIPLQPGIRLQETYSELNVGQTVLLEPRYVLLEDVMDTLTFTSMDESVATVDPNGLITTVAPGAADIVICCGEYIARYTVMVYAPTERIVITGLPETVSVGDVVELAVQFFPENTTDYRGIVWVSSDEDILFVNEIEGEGGYTFTALSAGTVTLTAQTVTGITAECEITVLDPDAHTHTWQDGVCSICAMTLAEAADLSGDGKITVFDAQMLAEAKSGVRTLSDAQWMLLGNMEPADIVAYILNGGAQKIILKELPKLTPTDNPLDDWHLAAFLKVEEKQPEDAQKRTEEEKPWNGSDNVCFDAQSKTAELLWELGKNGVLESSADTLIEMLGLQLTDSTGTVQNAAFTVLEVKYYTAVEGGYEEHVIKLKEADFCAERSEGVFAAEIAKIEDALKISDVVAIYVKAALDTEKMDAAMPEMAALLPETSVATKQENGC